MVYVISDLHGYPLEEFEKLLSKAGFSDRDYCFVLGDVIDRGDGGVELLEWLLYQPNVQLISTPMFGFFPRNQIFAGITRCS